jgi:large subunit ribosomal protein L30
MPQIQVKLVRSAIDRPERQKRTVQALGLNKMNSTATHESNPSILGMVASVKHLLEVTEL